MEFLRALRNPIFRRWRPATIAVLILAIAGCSDTPENAIERAQAYRARGDNVAAELEIRNALNSHQSNPAVLLLAGQFLVEVGDLSNAENALRRALEYGSTRASVLPSLARVLLELERYPEALEALKTDGKPDPATEPELMILRGRAFLGQGSFLEARTEFQVSQNRQPSMAAKLGLARLAAAENDHAAADRLIAEVLESEPKNVDALNLKGDLLRRDGRLDEAADAYRQAITVAPNEVAAVGSLATLELNRDRIDVAEPLVQRAGKIARQSPRARFAKGLLAFKTGRYEDAIAGLGDLLQVMPNHLPTLLLMGRVQYAAGRYDRAQLAFAAYLKRFPSDLQVHRMLAATLLAKGQPHLAVNVVAPFVRLTTDVGMLAVAADAYRLTGRFRESRSLLLRAVKLAPEDAELHTSMALTDLASGARQRGLASLETAIALGPKDSRADEALIMVMLGAGKTEEAGQAVDALEQRLPDLSPTHVLKAAVLFSRKDLAAARKSLDRALELDPENLDAVQALADVDAAEQKPDRRRERIQVILKKNPKHLGALLALARLELAEKRHDQGVAAIRRAIAEHPQSSNALLMLADTQFRYGQIGEAIISARQAHELHPFDTRAIAVLAEAQMASGDRQGAITTLNKLITLQPTAVSGYLRLAAVQLAGGDTKTAAATVLAALEKSPKDAGAIALLADIYLSGGEIDPALALGAAIRQEQPKIALGYRIEGDAFLSRGDYARALEAYRQVAAFGVNGALLVRVHRAQSEGSGRIADYKPLQEWVDREPTDVETRFYLAGVLARAVRHEEAAGHYKEILRQEPNSARALNDLAWTMHAAGDKRALEYAKQAAAFAPKNAAVVDTLGWILVQQGNLTEGVPELLKAMQLDGANPEIRYHLVQALLKIGDKERAKAELRAVLESKRPFPQLAEARSLAARLGP